jgi:hypothetical protein
MTKGASPNIIRHPAATKSPFCLSLHLFSAFSEFFKPKYLKVKDAQLTNIRRWLISAEDTNKKSSAGAELFVLCRI